MNGLSQQHIDLLPADLLPKAQFPSLSAVAVACLLLAVVLLVHGHRLMLEKEGLEAQLARLDARLAQLAQPARPATADAQARERELERLRQIGQLASQRGALGWSGHLRALARAHAEGLWLTGVTLEASTLRLEGRMLDASRLQPYLLRLARQPEFAGVRLAAVQVASVESTEQSDGHAPGLSFVLASEEAPRP